MKVIMHSSVSLDGSLLGFDVDMETHYRIVGSYKVDVPLKPLIWDTERRDNERQTAVA